MGPDLSQPQLKSRTPDEVLLSRVSATPVFDGAGGASVIVEVPPEPVHHGDMPHSGKSATIKLWTRASTEPRPVAAVGAPDAVRTEQTPCSIEMAGRPLDPREPAGYYAVSIRVFVDLDEVDAFTAVFDRAGREVHRDP